LLCWTYNGYNYQMSPTYYELKGRMCCAQNCNGSVLCMVCCLRACNLPDHWVDLMAPFIPISLNLCYYSTVCSSFAGCVSPGLFVWNKTRCAIVPNMSLFQRTL
jgi:hypothetical protein